MSEAIERFAAFLELSDKFLARAERDDLEEFARITYRPHMVTIVLTLTQERSLARGHGSLSD